MLLLAAVVVARRERWSGPAASLDGFIARKDAAECLRLGLADELRYSILPVVIGDGIKFFETLDDNVALHLCEVKAYDSGIVGLRYEIRL